MTDTDIFNPTIVARELDLSVHRDWGGQTLSWDKVVDAAVQKYWERRALRQIKRAV